MLVSYRMGLLQDEHTPWQSIIFSLTGAVYENSKTCDSHTERSKVGKPHPLSNSKREWGAFCLIASHFSVLCSRLHISLGFSMLASTISEPHLYQHTSSPIMSCTWSITDQKKAGLNFIQSHPLCRMSFIGLPKVGTADLAQPNKVLNSCPL